MQRNQNSIYLRAIKQEYDSKVDSLDVPIWDPSVRLNESGSLVGTFGISDFFIYVLNRSEWIKGKIFNNIDNIR